MRRSYFPHRGFWGTKRLRAPNGVATSEKWAGRLWARMAPAWLAIKLRIRGTRAALRADSARMARRPT